MNPFSKQNCLGGIVLNQIVKYFSFKNSRSRCLYENH